MAINSIHNSIGFPRLTNNRTGMLMTSLPSATKEEPKPAAPKIYEPELPPPPPDRAKDNTKYYLGAAAIAASAIAGIYLYTTRLKELPINTADAEPEKVIRYSFKLVEHTKDKVLEIFSKSPDPGLENKIEHSFQKLKRIDEKGKSILHKGEKEYTDRGLKRYDARLRPGGTVQTTFVDDSGRVRAAIEWDDEGNLFRYMIKDTRGNIVRDYNYTTPNISTKTYYNKDNVKIKEVQYNGKGWTYEQNYDDDGIFVDDFEIKPELK